MKHSLKYSLYSGAGNTFALLDEPISSLEAAHLCKACAIDGVIFSEENYFMRIFNADGSEAEMCGNGLRCFIRYLIDKGIHRQYYMINTLAGPHRAWANEELICIELPPPKDFKWNLEIEGYTLHHLNTGVPHAVIFVESVDSIDLQTLGSTIRHHPLFPEGVNVNIVEPHSLRMRTYERGVEGETPACGTGATAAALAAAKIYNLSSPLEMEVRSGERLTIKYSPDWQTVSLEGPAVSTGEGTFYLKAQSPILPLL